MKSYLLLTFILYAFWVPSLVAQPQIALELFSSGFDQPVAIRHAGDSRLFVVERDGRIIIVDSTGQKMPTPFLDIDPIVRSNASEQGLLGLAFHPDYANNGYFYVNYIQANRDTRISRFTRDSLNPNLADPNSEEILMDIDQPFNNHNGGDMCFGPDGYLYISTGDGGDAGDPQNHGQNAMTLLGNILRIDVDNGLPYTIPADNPFAGALSVANEIWSWGWRNPWRFSFDRLTGDMWVGDVGQNAYEEISVEWAGSQGGLNFGWRCYEANNSFNLNNCSTDSNAYQAANFAYQQGFNTGESVTGGYVYRGEKYTALYGYYVFGDYESGNFWTLIPDSNQNLTDISHGKLMSTKECSTFGEGHDGELYVASYGDGDIYHITETTTGIDPEAFDNPLKLFPHPLRDQSSLNFPNPNRQAFKLEVIDQQGRLCYAVEDIREDHFVLKKGKLSAGLYIVKLSGPLQYSRKLLVVD